MKERTVEMACGDGAQVVVTVKCSPEQLDEVQMRIAQVLSPMRNRAIVAAERAGTAKKKPCGCD